MDPKILEINGYFLARELPGRGVVALQRFAFTVGLVYGISEHFYEGRWCYARLADAVEAITSWDGVDDPPGEWIKYKGVGGERSRVPYEDE